MGRIKRERQQQKREGLPQIPERRPKLVIFGLLWIFYKWISLKFKIDWYQRIETWFVFIFLYLNRKVTWGSDFGLIQEYLGFQEMNLDICICPKCGRYIERTNGCNRMSHSCIGGWNNTVCIHCSRILDSNSHECILHLPPFGKNTSIRVFPSFKLSLGHVINLVIGVITFVLLLLFGLVLGMILKSSHYETLSQTYICWIGICFGSPILI
jgi:hypothetical protein